MAPPSASPVAMMTKRSLQFPGKSVGRTPKAAGTSSAVAPNQAVVPKSDTELVKDFKSDLQAIQKLATCSICVQLLYEPWTLGCGHTYCYSCLCNWFLPNRRKKTCPECRTHVRQIPAPAFIIKQMIEVFTNRSELMPIDETIEQHLRRKSAESDAVEADRTSELGLFKGLFNKQPLRLLQYNEEDHLYRCSRCSHEYLGGPMCENCGLDFEGDEEELDGFSDVDADLSVDEFDYHVDLDGVSDEDEDDLEDDIDELPQGPDFFREHISPFVSHIGHHESNIISWGPPGLVRGRRGDSNSSSSLTSEEEDSGSMRDFIEPDEGGYGEPSSYHSPGSTSHVSLGSRGTESVGGDNGDVDESSDEGGAISTARRRGQPAWAATRGSSSVVTVSDSASTSEAGDLAEESRRLQDSGWSPLEQEPDSDYGEHQPFVTHNNSGDSDTDTTVGNQASDDEDDEPRGNGSSTPVWATAPHFYDGDGEQSVDDHDEVDAYDSDVHETEFTDREGDVEMSVSPVSSRRTNTSNGNADRGSRRSVEIIGSANAVREVQGDSSDGTVQPANRRRWQPRYTRHSHTDPRISMMFAQHQLDLQDATARQSPYFEPAPRSWGTASSYRPLPARGPGSSSHPYSSPAVILTSVSNRPNRVQRQYPRRYFI